VVGNIFHEMFDPTDAAHKLLEGTTASGYSWQDYYLSLQGMAMGEALANGSLAIENGGNYIRLALAQPYAGTEDDSWRAAGTDWWPSKIWEGLLISLFK